MWMQIVAVHLLMSSGPVIADTVSGNATSVSGGSTFGRHKFRRAQWCLAEAKRQWNREQLLGATCISIMQDQRGSRFLIRFRCVNDKFEIATGLIDLSRVVGNVDYSGSDAIRRATLRGIQRACTPRSAPGSKSSCAPAPNPADVQSICSKIECFAADAAADEQLAGRELTGTLAGVSTSEIQDTMVQELVNLKVVCAYLFRKGRCLKLFIDPIVGLHSFRHGWLTGPARHPEFVCLRHSKMLQTRGKTCDWSVPGRSTMLQVMGICDLGSFGHIQNVAGASKILKTV